jgi:hypothetical protein
MPTKNFAILPYLNRIGMLINESFLAVKALLRPNLYKDVDNEGNK